MLTYPTCLKLKRYLSTKYFLCIRIFNRRNCHSFLGVQTLDIITNGPWSLQTPWGPDFVLGSPLFPTLLFICIDGNWLCSWIQRCSCGQILVQTTHFLHHNLVQSQFDSRMDTGSRSTKWEYRDFTSEASLWVSRDKKKRIPLFWWAGSFKDMCSWAAVRIETENGLQTQASRTRRQMKINKILNVDIRFSSSCFRNEIC